MKTALGIMSLGIFIVVIIQIMFSGTLVSIIGSMFAAPSFQIAVELGTGVLLALFLLVAGAFAFAFPVVSMFFLILGGGLAVANGAKVEFYYDLRMWGVITLVLAFLAFCIALKEGVDYAHETRNKLQL